MSTLPLSTPTRSALAEFLSTLLSTPSVSLLSDSSAPIELRTISLLIESAHSATIPQLAELILHILLSQPPFTHSTPSDLRPYQECFLALWTQDHDTIPGKLTAPESVLTANTGLGILSSMRVNFQRLSDSGFRLVCKLLLACLQRLSPEGSSRNLNIRGWIDAHGSGISVLAELLHSIPAVEWLRLEQAECALPLWECLQLLVSAASWWSTESAVYRENMIRLGRCVCVCTLPTLPGTESKN